MTSYNADGEPVDDPAYVTARVGDMRLNGEPLTKHLTDLVTDVQIELSIEEPSTATIACHDPGRLLLASGVLDEAVDVSVGKHAFRLVRVDKAGDSFTLTMEDRDVARLRLNRKSKKATRGKVTRAQFIKSMVDETGYIKFWAPDLDRVQPVLAPDEKVGTTVTESSRSRTKAAAGKSSRSPGFGPGVRLKVKGETATPQQLEIAARLLKVAAKEKASPLPTLAMICSSIGESTLSFAVNSLGYGGPLQAAAKNIAPTDVERQAHYFLRGGKGFNRGGAIALSKSVKDPGQIATLVETSGKPGSFYGVYAPEARKIIEAFTGDLGAFDSSAGGSSSITTTSLKPYEFTRGTDQGPESTWDAARRLADEVQRRFFIVDREAIFAFDRDLMMQQPVARIAEYQDGVDIIDWSRDTGKRIETATVACRGDAWLARPGDVIVTEDQGDASGRWLVSRISGPLSSISRTIELTRPMKGLREPSAETVTKTTTISAGSVSGSGSGGSGSGSGGSGSRRQKIVQIAKSSMTVNSGFRRYSQPGALTANPTPAAPARTDCSQWIRAVYLRAGAPDPGTNTYEMARKGRRTRKPGPGDIMLTANLGHCEIYIGGGRTIGHGSPPIDYGTTDYFPGHFFVTYSGL